MRDLLEEAVLSIDDCRIVASSTTEAEARLWLEENRESWDVAVVDLVLDQGSGLGVVTKAAQTCPDKKVAIFSSFVTPGIHEHAVRVGAAAVFAKDEPGAFLRWLGEVSKPAE